MATKTIKHPVVNTPLTMSIKIPLAIAYDADIAAWAQEQARFLRAGRFDLLDIEHIAEEIGDLAKSEKRELMNRLVQLLSHLLKWKFQPSHRGNSWTRTIKNQRFELEEHLTENPSLRPSLTNEQWFNHAWEKSILQASAETGIDIDSFPSVCPWAIAEIMDSEWLPES